MPDLPYLVGDEFAEVREKSNQTMRDAIAQMAADAAEADAGAADTGAADAGKAEE